MRGTIRAEASQNSARTPSESARDRTLADTSRISPHQTSKIERVEADDAKARQQRLAPDDSRGRHHRKRRQQRQRDARQRNPFARVQLVSRHALGQKRRKRVLFALANEHAMADGDQQQRHEQLINQCCGQPLKAAEIGARPRIGEHGRVLPVAFQKYRLTGDRVDAGVDHRKRRRRTENVMPVMHHSVRMTVRLGQESLFRQRLLFGAFVMFLAHPERGCDAGCSPATERKSAR